VRLLLQFGAYPNQKDPDGRSSFDYAQDKPAILKLLTEYASSAVAA